MPSDAMPGRERRPISFQDMFTTIAPLPSSCLSRSISLLPAADPLDGRGEVVAAGLTLRGHAGRIRPRTRRTWPGFHAQPLRVRWPSSFSLAAIASRLRPSARSWPMVGSRWR